MSSDTSISSPTVSMVITELDIGGAEKAFVRIAMGLKQRGWKVRVTSLRDAGSLVQDLLNEQIEVVALGCGGVFDIRAVSRLAAQFRRDRPDVVLSFLHQANLVSRFAAWRTGVRRVVCSIRVADRRQGVILPDRWTRQLVTRYVAVSQTVADVHAELCRLSQIPDVIRNGVDLEAIRRAEIVDRASMGCGPEDVIILSVGRLSDQKAPLNALEGFCRLRSLCAADLRDRLRLLYVGDGPLAGELQSRIVREQLSDCVRLLGWRADVWGLMKASNVLLLASKWEGLPNVLMEAQTARLPIVASAIDGNTELIQHGVTGRLFAAGSADGMASQLHEAILDSEHTQKMADAAIVAVSALTWDASVDAYDCLLRTVISS